MSDDVLTQAHTFVKNETIILQLYTCFVPTYIYYIALYKYNYSCIFGAFMEEAYYFIVYRHRLQLCLFAEAWP